MSMIVGSWPGSAFSVFAVADFGVAFGFTALDLGVALAFGAVADFLTVVDLVAGAAFLVVLGFAADDLVTRPVAVFFARGLLVLAVVFAVEGATAFFAEAAFFLTTVAAFLGVVTVVVAVLIVSRGLVTPEAPLVTAMMDAFVGRVMSIWRSAAEQLVERCIW